MMTPEDEKASLSSDNDIFSRQKSLEVSYGTIGVKDEKHDKCPPELTRMERWFPTGFKYEAYELCTFAWPLVLTVFLNFMIRVAGTMFSGQLGPIELDAVSMGLSIANVIGTSIGIGLIAACDTLFAQSYGSVNKKQVGVYLQTAIYISSLCCIVSWALLFNTNYILLVLGQNPEVARATEEFIYFFMPALYFLFLFQLLQKYLQVQGVIIPVVVVGIVANIVNIGLQYLVINVANWGIKGSAIGQTISYFILVTLTLAYMLYTGCHQKTWDGWSRRACRDWGEFMKLGLSTDTESASLQGWSRRACRDWGEFMKLGLSSIAMICLEWWTYEISAFLTGILGEVELGASSIAYQIYTIYAAVPLGISSACAFRIGRYLGEERLDAALTVTRVTFVLSASLSVVSGLVILALHKQLPYLFSQDPEILDLAQQLLLLLALFIFIVCAKTIFAGIIRGTGRQVAGGVISFVAFFIFAMPIGIPLMFLTPARAAGFWWGMVVGGTISCVSLMVIVWRTDWVEEGKQAQVRAKANKKKKKKRESESIYTPTYDETSGLLGNGSPAMTSEHSALIAEDELALSRSITISASFDLESTLQRRNYWRNIIIQKLVITVVCFVILIFGIICRFVIFIPPDIPTILNSNSTKLWLNSTTLSSTVSTTLTEL